ncbi:penicillin acylase family protein [Bacteroidia bacterium]|nr:penicillin acylase family protein [Bacteroidia bacterium]MDB9883192.1 penicillin acylase family protein [Bacteroidia bacterium]
MRKYLGLITLSIGLVLLYFLQKPHTVSGNPIPPLGKLLNPYSGAWQNAEDPSQYTSFNLNSNQVKEDVKIVFDDRMVPHIYAQNLQDALFAQGYVEAYHRLFQMDISTRSPDGRLSEVLGEKLLDYDKKQRRLGLGYAADNAVKGWSKFSDQLKNVESYTAGVNHFITNLKPKDYPIEYKLLDFEPTEWTNRHSALLLKAMTQTLAGYEEDIEMSNAYRIFGAEDFNLIYPDRNPKDTAVTQGPYDVANTSYQTHAALLQTELNLPSTSRPRSPDGVGSNNWAISSSKSATGKPILANDPHLGLSLPSTWYEIAITTPEFSAQGVTLLGMPGIMIGFNEHIAWGETNVGHDMMDYHHIQWTNEKKTKYHFDSSIVDADIKIESFQVKGLGEVLDTVRYTHWGPIVEDATDLALRWIAHDPAPTPEFMAFVDGMACNNYDDYLKATAVFNSPAQNFIYADNKGEIGIRVNGALPIKKHRQGVMISPGTSSDDGWKGFILRENNPQERNPTKGFVSSCNQYSANEDYPFYYNGNFEPYRGRMTNRLLSSRDSFNVTDFKAMQNSNYSILAEEALAVMLPLLDSSNSLHPQALGLRSWNFEYNASSIYPVWFDHWFKTFHEMLWDEVYTKQTDVALPAPDVWVTVNMVESVERSKFYDIEATPNIETLQELVNKSFATSLLPEPATFGEVKNAQILHLTKLPAFSENLLLLGGTKHSLNAMQQTFGPSWRMIVELGDTPEAHVTYPGGQSGNPASPFYKNRIATWASGNYDHILLAPKESDIKTALFSITVSNEK